MEPLRNSYLGQYLLTDIVGRSGSAVVYKAYQASLNRYVAVKVLVRGLDPHYISRFEREAYAIAQLQHRNILPIYDFGQQGDWRYLVMQYVEDGASLADRLARGPMELVATLELLLHLLGALEYAHKQGVIHRDIKPSNILMPAPDWPLLADFGIAKLLNAAQLTPPGQAMGTAAYMAPETGMQRPIDGRADLYSVGVLLFEMVTGEVPFDAATPLLLLTKHMYDPPPLPRSRRPDLPPVVEEVILRALEKDPDARYQSAAEMAMALGEALRKLRRAQAQGWLLGQLGGQGFIPTRRRSGYTTGKLPAASGSLQAGTATGRPAHRLPLLLLLAIAALLMGLALGTLALNALPRPVVREPLIARQAPTLTPPPTALPATALPPEVLPGEVPPAAPPATPPQAALPVPTTVLPTPVPQPPTISPEGEAIVLLEDEQWRDGYALSRGSNRYAGRTAVWIYGSTTEYSTMWATFEVVGQPTGEVVLRIEGMDSEGRVKTPISIAINGAEIYNGPNPLPDDDLPLESGTWASEFWSFDAGLLRPGINQISIRNLARGSFGGPPFFMLDYAEISYTT